MTDKNDKISALLDVAAGKALPVLRGVTDDQLTAPTPCSAYDVHALLDHLFQVVVNFQALAAKEPVDFAAPPEHLAGDWRERFPAEVDKLIAAWDAPGSEEGVSKGMGIQNRTVGAMVLGDLAVHSWDLARATGQPYEPDPALVEVLAIEFGDLGPTARKMKVFGEPFPVADDATPFELVLAMTGRDPNWARP